ECGSRMWLKNRSYVANLSALVLKATSPRMSAAIPGFDPRESLRSSWGLKTENTYESLDGVDDDERFFAVGRRSCRRDQEGQGCPARNLEGHRFGEQGREGACRGHQGSAAHFSRRCDPDP